MSKPADFAHYPDVLAEQAGFGPYRAVVKRVIDGDTLYVLIDQGLNNYAYESIRLRDVDAPELFSGDDREAGAEARDHLSGLVSEGTPVYVVTHKDSMSFGRYVGIVFYLGPDDMVRVVNDDMRAWLQIAYPPTATIPTPGMQRTPLS